MYKLKNIFIKISILFLITIIPIIVLFFYTKENTYIQKEQKLPTAYTKYFKEGYTLLYIGYTGCVNVCMPRLKEISIIQRVLNDKGHNINYSFLDLRDLGKDISEDFLKAFEGKFEVLFIAKENKKLFLRELNFYASKSLYDSNEFEHSSYLYLIKKKQNDVKLIATVMQYPFNSDKTIEFINKRLNDAK